MKENGNKRGVEKDISKRDDAPDDGPNANRSYRDSALVKFDPLQRYLQEVGQYHLLSREEEKELAIRVREHGDPDAAYRLVTSNLRLVVKIALEFQANQTYFLRSSD